MADTTDRDPRKERTMAEEIRTYQGFEVAGRRVRAHQEDEWRSAHLEAEVPCTWEDQLLTPISEAQAALARAERAEAREVALRRSAERVVEVISSGHTADDLYEASDELERALATPSPVANAMAGVVEAAVAARPYARFTLELRDAVDALQAARAGRGEGE